MKSFFTKSTIARLCASVVASTMLATSIGMYADAEEIEGEEVIVEEIAADDEIETYVETQSDEDADEEVDEIYVEYIDEAELVSITSGGIDYVDIGSGRYKAVSYSGSSNSINIPEKVGSYTVTVIGENFLYNNENKANIVSVSIPSTVTEIQKNAFRDCTNLQNVSFGYTKEKRNGFYSDEIRVTSLRTIGEYAFYGDSKISQIDLAPDGLATISAYAFAGCTGITYLTLTSTVTTIGTDAFKDLDNLQSFTYYGVLSQWMSINFASNTKGTHPNAYAKQINIPEYEQNWSYEDAVFKPIESITIPSTMTEVKAYLFAGFKDLKTVNLSNTNTISEYAFSGCVKLTSVDLTNVNTVKAGAFSNCTSLEKVTVPDRLSTIGDYAFYNDAKLKTIYLGIGLSTIGSKSFAGCSILNDIVIEKNFTSIPDDAFDGCEKLNIVSVYSGTVADNYFKAFTNCWVKYLDSTITDANLDDRLVGYSALFDGSIGLKFFFSSSGVSPDRDYVRFVIPTENGSETKDIKFSEATLKDGKYVFTIPIAPRYVYKQVGAKVVVNGGGKTYWISFADYASAVLTYNELIPVSNSSENIKLLIRALLTYGYASAEYFGDDTSAAKESFMLREAEINNPSSTYIANISNKDYLGMSMTLDDTYTMKLYFKGKHDIKVIYKGSYFLGDLSRDVSCECIGDQYTVLTVKGYKFGGSVWSNTSVTTSIMLNIVYDNIESKDSFCGLSYLCDAVNSGNEKLQYLARVIYTVECYANNTRQDVLVEKKK